MKAIITISQVKYCAAALAAGITLLIPVVPARSADQATGTPPQAAADAQAAAFGQRLQDAYDLGRLMQEPVISVLYLDAKLKDLANYKSDADASAAIVADAKIADTTRTSEAVAYGDAAKLLTRMSAPPGVIAACKSAQQTVTGELQVTSDAAKAASDPVTKRIIATLDEADAIRPDNSNLLPWLKLSRGADALWAFHLGQFAVGLDNSLDLSAPSMYQPELLGTLSHNTPGDLPPTLAAVLDNLRNVSPGDPKSPAVEITAKSAIAAVFGN